MIKDKYVTEIGIPKKLPNQIASLHIVIINKKTYQTQIFNLGDCKSGYWINQTFSPLPELHHPTYDLSQSTHLLSSAFRTKKPIGEIFERHIQLDKTSNYCLCTDGFWRMETPNLDDCSLLLISEIEKSNLNIQKNAENFKVFLI